VKKIISPISKEKLIQDIQQLPTDSLLTERGDFQVFIATAKYLPHLLQEIGRLRETTFREVGEGTGKAIDLDQYDDYYHNLFIWDKAKKQLVGGYRVGTGHTIFEQYNSSGFYINSLFDIAPAAHPILQNSLELGRSYIVSAYQKGFLPLFLLWQGILAFLIKNPSYQYLIGPVSISKYYSTTSKSMIIQFVKKHFYNTSIAQHFQPKTPFAYTSMNMEHLGNSIKDLETFMSTIEPSHIKVPVLLRQYTKLNAQFIGFNLDPNFSDALDGLMLLNLEQLPKEILTLLQEK